MQIPSQGVEWGDLTFAVPVPQGSDVTVSTDMETWVPAVYDATRPGDWKVLVAGPAASVAGLTNCVQIAGASQHVFVRVRILQEVVIRSAGRVTVGQ